MQQHTVLAEVIESFNETPIQQETIQKIWQQMLLFAKKQLRDESLAEDVVQETFVAVIKNIESFKAEAALKTWVFAILRRKIVDHFRSAQRTPTEKTEAIITDDEESLDLLFDDRGRWHPHFSPQNWGDPEDSLTSDQFWAIFDICLNELPEKQCTVFMMREHIGLSTEKIKNELHMTTSLVNVTLHRARLRLQQCLSIRWYGDSL